jgi:hypothetical protein
VSHIHFVKTGARTVAEKFTDRLKHQTTICSR